MNSTYLKSSRVKTILAQSCLLSMMSSTSPIAHSRNVRIHNYATRTTREQTVEINLPFEVRVMEDLHGYLLLPVVLRLEFRVVDRDVFLNVSLREFDLVVLALAVHAHRRPVRHGDRNAEQQQQEEAS